MNASGHNSSSRGIYQLLIATMWVAPLYIAFRYWQVWDQLPPRMVTHFGANGQPNGWMTPQQSLTFSLVLSGVVLLLFSAILVYAIRRTHALDASIWALLGLLYVILSVITVICDSVLNYNLSQSSIPISAIGAVLLVAIFVFVVIFLRAQRGSALPPSVIIAEETHASSILAWVLLLPAIPMTASAVTVPIPAVKIILFSAAVAVLGGAAMAWDGFHYLFSTAGVEIRTLGFRLRSIPAGDIQNYEADRWNALGGYGIRGLGSRR